MSSQSQPGLSEARQRIPCSVERKASGEQCSRLLVIVQSALAAQRGTHRTRTAQESSMRAFRAECWRRTASRAAIHTRCSCQLHRHHGAIERQARPGSVRPQTTRDPWSTQQSRSCARPCRGPRAQSTCTASAHSTRHSARPVRAPGTLLAHEPALGQQVPTASGRRAQLADRQRTGTSCERAHSFPSTVRAREPSSARSRKSTKLQRADPCELKPRRPNWHRHRSSFRSICAQPPANRREPSSEWRCPLKLAGSQNSSLAKFSAPRACGAHLSLTMSCLPHLLCMVLVQIGR
jgi:hypothetical protein